MSEGEAVKEPSPRKEQLGINAFPIIEYDKSLEGAPYTVRVDGEKLAGLLAKFGMEDEDIGKQHIVLARKLPVRFRVRGLGVIGVKERGVNRLRLALDPAWDLYQKHLKLAWDLVEGRKNPNKRQFSNFLYTKRLPPYLAKAPPERGLQFATKLFLNALQRKQSELLFHETRHALDEVVDPHLLERRKRAHKIGEIAGRIFGGSWLAAHLLDTLVFGELRIGYPAFFLLGLNAFLGPLILAYGIEGFLPGSEQQRAEKFAKTLKNNPDWREIITIRPKTNTGISGTF